MSSSSGSGGWQGGQGGGPGGWGPPPSQGGGWGPPPGQPWQGGGYGPDFGSKPTTAMVLGIVGLVCCSPLGIAALVLGHQVRRDARAANVPTPGQATAGYVLGWIAVGFLILTVIYFIVVVAVAAGDDDSSGRVLSSLA